MYDTLPNVISDSLNAILSNKNKEGIFVSVRPVYIPEELAEPGYITGEDFYEASLKVPGWGALIGALGKKKAPDYWTYKRTLARVAREVTEKLRTDKELKKLILINYEEDLLTEMSSRVG